MRWINPKKKASRKTLPQISSVQRPTRFNESCQTFFFLIKSTQALHTALPLAHTRAREHTLHNTLSTRRSHFIPIACINLYIFKSTVISKAKPTEHGRMAKINNMLCVSVCVCCAAYMQHYNGRRSHPHALQQRRSQNQSLPACECRCWCSAGALSWPLPFFIFVHRVCWPTSTLSWDFSLLLFSRCSTTRGPCTSINGTSAGARECEYISFG